MSEVSIIGVDLAKRVFQVHGALPDGNVAFRKKLSRSQFMRFLAEHAQEMRWQVLLQVGVPEASIHCPMMGASLSWSTNWPASNCSFSTIGAPTGSQTNNTSIYSNSSRNAISVALPSSPRNCPSQAGTT